MGLSMPEPGGREMKTFDTLTGEQQKTHELISNLQDVLRPVLIQRPETAEAVPQEVAPSQMSERVRDQQLINERLRRLHVDLDL